MMRRFEELFTVTHWRPVTWRYRIGHPLSGQVSSRTLEPCKLPDTYVVRLSDGKIMVG